MSEDRRSPPDDAFSESPHGRTPAEERRLRELLLKDFKEIAVEEPPPPPREDLLTVSLAFGAGLLILAGVAIWKDRRTSVPAEALELRTQTSLPRLGGNGFLTVASPLPSPRATFARPSPSISPRILASPSPSPSIAVSMAIIAEAVRNDDICTVLPVARAEPIELLRALPEFSSLSTDAQILIAAASGDSPATQLETLRNAGSSDFAQFYEALMLAGLLSNANGEADLTRAHQILSELAARYADNGAFAYYETAVLQRLGRSADEVDEAIVRFSEASTYDEGSASVYREIRDRFSGSVSESVTALGAIASVPIPDIRAPLAVISARLRDREDLAPAVFSATQRFREEEGQRAGGPEFFDWSAVKVNAFGTLGRTAWAKTSAEPFPSAIAGTVSFQKAQDLLALSAGKDSELGDYYSLLEKAIDPATCDPQIYREAFSRTGGPRR